MLCRLQIEGCVEAQGLTRGSKAAPWLRSTAEVQLHSLCLVYSFGSDRISSSAWPRWELGSDPGEQEPRLWRLEGYTGRRLGVGAQQERSKEGVHRAKKRSSMFRVKARRAGIESERGLGVAQGVGNLISD